MLVYSGNHRSYINEPLPLYKRIITVMNQTLTIASGFIVTPFPSLGTHPPWYTLQLKTNITSVHSWRTQGSIEHLDTAILRVIKRATVNSCKHK